MYSLSSIYILERALNLWVPLFCYQENELLPFRVLQCPYFRFHLHALIYVCQPMFLLYYSGLKIGDPKFYGVLGHGLKPKLPTYLAKILSQT